MAEAAHGTAPSLHGKDVANPMAMILAGAALLGHADDDEGSDRRPGDPRRLPRGRGQRRPDRRPRRPRRHDGVHRRGDPADDDEARGLGLALTCSWPRLRSRHRCSIGLSASGDDLGGVARRRRAPRTSGSNWVPAHRSTSRERLEAQGASRYGRTRGHRVERVGDREQPALERDVAAGAPRRVAAAVPALVVEQHVREGGSERGTPAISQAPSTGCARISASSASSSLPGLASTLVANVHLADVVERRAEPEIVERLVGPAEPARDGLGVCADTRGVTLERTGRRRPSRR